MIREGFMVSRYGSKSAWNRLSSPPAFVFALRPDFHLGVTQLLGVVPLNGSKYHLGRLYMLQLAGLQRVTVVLIALAVRPRERESTWRPDQPPALRVIFFFFKCSNDP